MGAQQSRARHTSGPPPFSSTTFFTFPPSLYTSTSRTLTQLLQTSLASLAAFQSQLTSTPPSHLTLTSYVRSIDESVVLPPSVELVYRLDTVATYSPTAAVQYSVARYVLAASERMKCAHEAVAVHEQWMAIKYMHVEQLMRLRHQHILGAAHITNSPSHPRLTLCLLLSSAWKCYRLVRRIEQMESLLTRQKQQLHGRPVPADFIQSIQQLVNTQQRLRDALADNDRYRVAIDWLQHDYHITFAAFRTQELILQQQELQTVTAASQPTQLWTTPEPADTNHQQLRLLYGQLQHKLHKHRVTLLGVGLYYKDRNMTQAVEWEEADDLDARLFSLLTSSEEDSGRRRRVARAVTAEDVCLSTVLLSLAMHRARDEVRQLQEENDTLRAELQQVVEDESWYARNELQDETERVEQLDNALRRCTIVIMSPFSAAVTTYWQQMPEVKQFSTHPAHTIHTYSHLAQPSIHCVLRGVMCDTQLQSASSLRRVLDELVYRNQHLTQLDTLQPPPEVVLRHALRAALGNCCVSTVWSDNDDLTDRNRASTAAGQQAAATDRPTKREGLAAAEAVTSGVTDWPVYAETETSIAHETSATGQQVQEAQWPKESERGGLAAAEMEAKGGNEWAVFLQTEMKEDC